MPITNEITKSEQNLYPEALSEQLTKKLFLKEMLKIIQEKIESNDEVFIRTLKHYLSEENNTKRKV